MQVNPYNNALDRLQSDKKAAVGRIAELSRQLDWYRDFKPETTHARRLGIGRTLADHAAKQADDAVQLAGMRERMQHLRAAKRAAEEEAKAGLDPRSWISSERSVAKRKADELGNQIAQLDIDIGTLAASKMQAVKGLQAASDALQRDLDIYRCFDPLLAQSEVAMRTAELAYLEAELVRIRTRKLALDRAIAPLWQRLEACRAQRSGLERDLRKADMFCEQLAAAQGNRAAIHQACERALGDGSNMAHHGGDFIGLQALEAVVPVLAAKCAVTINFDPGFRRKIGLSSSDVRARFPQASVYFAPHGMKADPFVLKHGDGKPHAYVISNDKFSEFLDKEVVQQGRILKHAVMNNAAQIPDLDISVPLTHT